MCRFHSFLYVGIHIVCTTKTAYNRDIVLPIASHVDYFWCCLATRFICDAHAGSSPNWSMVVASCTKTSSRNLSPPILCLKVSGTPRKVRQLPANFGVIPVTFWEPFIFSSSNSKISDCWSENNLIWRETFHTNRVFCVFRYMRNNEDYVPKNKTYVSKNGHVKNPKASVCTPYCRNQ